MGVGTLTVETDWDFSLIIAGELFCESEFSVEIYSIETLNSIQISGPFGSPTGGKSWEIEDALEQIKNNPTEFFSNLGGNRGAMWYPDGWVWSMDDSENDE